MLTSLFIFVLTLDQEGSKPSCLKEYDGQIATVLSLAITLVIAVWGYSINDALLTSIAVGALGGLVHEIAQTGGVFMLPGRDATNPSNVYLGGLYGLIAGGIAGLLLAQGANQSAQILAQSNPGIPTSFLSDAFLAGLGLKGVSEAIADQTQGVAQTQTS